MPCLGAPLTLAVCEHFKRNYLRWREAGQALGKLTLAALLSQRKTNNIVRWVGSHLSLLAGDVCTYSVRLQVFGERGKKKDSICSSHNAVARRYRVALSSGTAANQQMHSAFVWSTYHFQQVVSKEAVMLLCARNTEHHCFVSSGSGTALDFALIS